MEKLMEMLPFLLPLLIVELILLIVALRHILTHDTYKRGNRILWIVVVIVGMNYVGPIAYFLVGKEEA